jgi:hypothetical protein
LTKEVSEKVNEGKTEEVNEGKNEELNEEVNERENDELMNGKEMDYHCRGEFHDQGDR